MDLPRQELDFIVIGAQKSATTTLFQYLRHHPEVALPAGKEFPYFSHDGVFERGWRPYMEALVREGRMEDPARTWGTITPQYMAGGVVHGARAREARNYDERTVPRRIRDQLPNVRLVTILRDPVERALSHHRMMVRHGSERRTFDQAVAELLEPERLREARSLPDASTGYVVWGEYSRVLGGYLDIFDRSQLLVLFTDELDDAPQELMRRLQGFIGVSEAFVAPNLGERYFVSRPEAGFRWSRPGTWMNRSSPLSPQGLQRGLRRLPGARALWHAIPFEGQQRLWRPYERLAKKATVRSRRGAPNEVRANTPPRPETIARLREHYAADAERLTELVGVEPYWQRTGAPS